MNQNQHRVQCGVWGLAAMLLILPMLVPASKGQDSRGQRVSKANSTRRVALVIGNAAYTEAPLKNPVNDARDMAAALREMGFEVTELHNQNFEQMETAIQTFGQRLSGGGAGLFYFAGHGVQTKDNQNYLIPVGGTITAENVKYRAVNVGELTEQMQAAQNGINLIILDACRNNPWRGLRSGARGLAAMDAPKGTLIA
ncbi:MAG TPA: caspase family protein, partial [Acidobacteriota bacterium]|nr:caspase family protein [Acidobacteriota bacterium]